MKESVLQITAPVAAAVISVDVQPGEQLRKDQPLVTLESMKMQTAVSAPCDCVVKKVLVAAGDTIQIGQLICQVVAVESGADAAETLTAEQTVIGDPLYELQKQLSYSSDEERVDAVARRHEKG